MKKAFAITIFILCSIVVVLSVIIVNTTNNLSSTTASLENMYQRSFYELVNNVNNMDVEVGKLMVSGDATSQQKSLAKLKQQTSDAENSLSLLPVNSNVLEKTAQFMNHFNGYCSSLITYQQGKIKEDDYVILSQAQDSIDKIKIELNAIMEKVINGEKISENLTENGQGEFALNFTNLSSDTIEYPSMIYDGPFSDSTINKDIKGLSKKEISKENAEKLVEKVFENKATGINFVGETNGRFKTYDFVVNTSSNNYFVQISKQGGFLLTISADVVPMTENEEENIENIQDNEKSNKSSIEGIKAESINKKSEENISASSIAENFAKLLGIEKMKTVWSASSQDIAYINLAPIIDDIVMYPDLIKAKIDLSKNALIGWEASSYAYNHIERDELIPQLTEKEAKALVNKNLLVSTQRLCVIPLEFSGETLAYEFAGTYKNSHYYLYIDAYSGEQIKIMKVVQTDEGELVL